MSQDNVQVKHENTPVSAHGPRPASCVRLVGTACVLLVAAGFSFVVGWWPLGIIFTVLTLLMIGACVALGAFGVKLALVAHANMFMALAPKHEGSRKTSEMNGDEDRVKAEDGQVGFMLTSAGSAALDASLEEPLRSRLKEARLHERAATLSWLEKIPAPEGVEVVADDGATLWGECFVCNPASSRWAVLAHGYAGSGRQMMLYARAWAERGYNLLLCDMRGHGKSGGAYIGMGYLDRRDLVAWCQWIVERFGEDVAIVLHGHSMGGASVCEAAGEPDLPPQVMAAVSDCAYTSAWETFAPLVEDAIGLPEHPTLDLVSLNLRLRRGGYALSAARPVGAVCRARIPMLFVHGANDDQVPAHMCQELFDACASSQKDLLMVAGAAHCSAVLADPEAYWSRVDALLLREEQAQ